MSELVIDCLGRLASEAPRAPLLADRTDAAWQALTQGRAWAESGAVASWLIAHGFGPEPTRVAVCGLAVDAPDSPERAVLLLGALRAGAAVIDDEAALAFVCHEGRLLVASGPHAGVALAALAHGSIDAAVAERRLHIDSNTPARLSNDKCVRHGDLATIRQAVMLEADDPSP